jgi:hypothetical protein
MPRLFAGSIFLVVFLCGAASAKAQNIVVPAGTLLRCTLDEPNFSSATADVGDPVVCHLSSLREFGQNVFPRGSYLGGHLEDAKEPGHFVGKGYLKIQFDRIGFPNSDVPVPSKVIAANKFRVDKKGDIVGKGHAKRDIVEWLIPPLWPWKIITLPARGPRPALKGESQITVRLMDDIEVPRTGAASRSFERPASYDGPVPYHQKSFDRPVADQPAAPGKAAENIADIAYAPVVVSAVEPEVARPVLTVRLRKLALKSQDVYTVTKYQINAGSVSYMLASGATGSIDITAVDWRATSRLNAEPILSSADQTDQRADAY